MEAQMGRLCPPDCEKMFKNELVTTVNFLKRPGLPESCDTKYVNV